VVVRLSDSTTDTSAETEAEPKALPGDGLREGIVDELRRRLGESLVDTVLRPNDDLWVRVATPAWRQAGEAALALGFDYFCFLSALDWMPSPYGRGEDDPTQPPPERSTAIVQGVTGGDTRFQVFARLTDTRRHVSFTLKVDVPEDTMTVDSWFAVYAGANWHERETHEMFGISFAGHPDLRNMYLPMEFEGYPLRKDFPLLARMVKPWPGIVDVEPMPAEEQPPQDEVEGDVAPENPTPDQTDAGLGAAPAEDAAGAAAAGVSAEEAPDHESPPPGDEGRTDKRNEP
jgi:NADH-quinone oxidoreductase subunit C